MPPLASLRTAQATPLGRRAPYRLAYELMGRIKAGVFSRGDWLPTEHELMTEFPVSRTTLREALIVLECLGVIASHHGVGSQVISGRPKSDVSTPALDLVSLLEACRAFEVEAAGLAARLDEEDETALVLRGPSLSGPMSAEACRHFHVSLAHTTGNAAIAASIEHLWDIAVARPDIRDPLDGALARAGRTVRTAQGRVVEGLLRRSPSDTRQAVGALFDGYLAAVMDFEEQERLARIQGEGSGAASAGAVRAIAADRSRLDETKT